MHRSAILQSLLIFALLVTTGYVPFHQATHLTSKHIESDHDALEGLRIIEGYTVDYRFDDSQHHHEHESDGSLSNCDICLLTSGLNGTFQTTWADTICDAYPSLTERYSASPLNRFISPYQSRAPPVVS